MLSGVQNGNGTPHDRYNIRGNAHARTNKKDDIFIQRRLVQSFKCIRKWGQGTKSPEFCAKGATIDKTFPAEAYSCMQV